eukprot:scaffold185326_cov33-Tisochrysis_lutea.AAC.5
MIPQPAQQCEGRSKAGARPDVPPAQERDELCAGQLLAGRCPRPGRRCRCTAQCSPGGGCHHRARKCSEVWNP